MRGRNGSVVVLLVSLVGLVAGCSSRRAPIAPALPSHYEDLGPAQGRACGVQIALLPFALNSRIERAYQAAVRSVPGAVAVRDVTMTDRWIWIGIGTQWCATVRGIGIR